MGSFRCQCASGYQSYGGMIGAVDTFCGKTLTSATQSQCRLCETNGGTCYQPSTNDTTNPNPVDCMCPISKSGTNCEIANVNVTCDGPTLQMKICYDAHPNVNFSNGWIMAANNFASVPACQGFNVTDAATATASSCQVGYEALVLDLSPAGLAKCGTLVTLSTDTKTYVNTIVVTNGPDTPPIVFETYCTYRSYDAETFAGLGIYLNNGNSNGQVVNPDISLDILDQFGSKLQSGVLLQLNDPIQFKVSLNLTGSYSSMAVQWCSASTSSYLPNSHASTIPLINNGCPLANIPGGQQNWYWTALASPPASQYVIESGLIKAFKLGSSNTVYLHCTLQLCLSGDTSCQLSTKATCAAKGLRRKRSATVGALVSFDGLFSRQRRAAADSYEVVNSFEIVDTSMAGATVALIVIVVLVIVVLVVFGGAVAWLRMKRQRKQYNIRPEMFAMPRLQEPYNRF